MKKVILIGFMFLCVLASFAIGGSAGDDVDDYRFRVEINRIIEPGKSVGDITTESTEDDLKKIYGAGNVSRLTLKDETNTKRHASRIHVSSKETIDIMWKGNKYDEIWRVIIKKNAEKWTGNSLKIGMTLDELEKVNGKSFILNALTESNYKITSASWNDGEISEKYKVEMMINTPPRGKDLRAEDEEEKLDNTKTYPSSSTEMILLDLKVKTIIIEW